jgi:hypothetical protein
VYAQWDGGGGGETIHLPTSLFLVGTGALGIVGAQGPPWLRAPSKKSQVANLWEGGRRPGDMVELYRTGRDWPKADLALPI